MKSSYLSIYHRNAKIDSMKCCLICGFQDKYPICSDCSKDPFDLEKCRQVLAEKKDFDVLKTLYNSSLAQIQDKNTSVFWNQKLGEIQLLKDQDRMTKDRIFTAASYIPKGAKRILDVGAGYGFLEEYVSKKKYNFELYGLDISQKAVKNLKKRFAGSFTAGTIYDLPYKNDFFDTIIALEILEHIPPKKTFKVLRELRRVLSSTGILIISVPLNEGLSRKKENPSGHVREYTSALVKAELRLAGFRPVEGRELFAFSSFYNLKNFLQRFILLHRWESNNIVIKSIKI